MSPNDPISPSPSPRSHIRLGHALYLCCAAEVVVGFGSAVGSMPWTRLVESIICRRHAGGATTDTMDTDMDSRPSLEQMLLSMLLIGGRGGSTAEASCKGDIVQAEMAEM